MTSSRHLFINAFKDLTFYKVKVERGYVVFAANVYSLTVDGLKYVIAITPNTPEMRDFDKAKIQHLRWISLQTRTLVDTQYDVPSQTLDYKPLDARYADEKITLKAIARTKAMTEYECDLQIDGKPIRVSLLNDPKKKSMYQHPEEIELRHALKTFQCIIRLV